ncbi:MAG: S9 family peptidase [Myxococcota bacterium]
MSELIPRAVLFGDPDRSRVTISPDGRWIAFLAPVDGIVQLFVRPVDGGERPLTAHSGAGVRDYQWLRDGRSLVFVTDADGDENWQLSLARVDEDVVTTLVAESGVQARLYPTSRHHPDRILVGLNDRDPRFHDLVAIRPDGARERLFVNDRFVGFVLDWAHVPVYGLEPTAGGGMNVHRRDGDDWRLEAEIPLADTSTTQPGRCTADGRTWYWLDGRDRDTAALVAVAESGERTVLAEFTGADVDDILAHPVTGEAQVAMATRVQREHIVLDDTITPHLERLRAHHPGDLSVLSRSDDDTGWIAHWSRDDGPSLYGLYDTSTGAVTSLFVDREALSGLPLRPREGVEIPTRDGLSMVSYLSRPEGDGPHPLILFVHGGPWARDAPGFEPNHQFFANRGYAVLSPNFRGSTGFGKAFLNAGDHEWAGRMHDDLLDAVEWAIAQGVTTRDQVAIMGGSYGGYATLVGLTFTPDVFVCGVDIVGPSNLQTLLGSIPPYWAPLLGTFKMRVGDPDTEAGRAELWARSPLSRVDDLARPLLIAQGANDPRVKQAESEQIVDALKQRGVPVRYALFPDEGHGFGRAGNRLAFYAITEAFLAEHLGGRAESPGDTVATSSMILT